MCTQQPGLLDFINPLQSCEQQASIYRQWRLHQELLVSMECLVTCMTSDQLYNKFVPILFKCISTPVSNLHIFLHCISTYNICTCILYWHMLHMLMSAKVCLFSCVQCVLPVKLAACKTLCTFIRNIRKQELRHELCARLNEGNQPHSTFIVYIIISSILFRLCPAL